MQGLYRLLFFMKFAFFCHCSSVEYYENLFETYSKIIENYRFPSDASEYKPHNNDIIDAGTYDIIIVGLGVSGSIIAHRLSEISEWNVLALEAGDFGNNFTDVPGMFVDAFYTDYGWTLHSVPQDAGCLRFANRSCTLVRGRGVGGGSIINAMMYNRGAEKDFDIWEREVGEEWSYTEVLSSYKKTESFHDIHPMSKVDWDYHGREGELNIEQFIPVTTLESAMYDSAFEIGQQIVDQNAKDQIGISSSDVYVKNLKRQDTGTVFVKPILNKRKNLKVLTRSFATKIGIDDNNKATTVEFSRNNNSYIAHSTKEIILSAGTYGSAQLLMLSGVGPMQHLEEVGIDVVQDLPVGEFYQDPPTFRGLQYTINVTFPKSGLQDEIKKYVNGTRGFLSRTTVGAVDYFQSSVEQQSNFPDIEVVISYATMPVLATPSDPGYSGYTGDDDIIALIIRLMRPESAGTVKLKSKSPFDFPLVNPNFLSDKNGNDLDRMYSGIEKTLLLMNGTALKKIGVELVPNQHPECSQHKYLSKNFFNCVLRHVSLGYSHPVASCRMGKDKNDSIVDARLRVHGVANLRVADGSVFRKAVVGHPSATCMMVAEKVSDMIKQDHGLYVM